MNARITNPINDRIPEPIRDRISISNILINNILTGIDFLTLNDLILIERITAQLPRHRIAPSRSVFICES
jgi:hypothetical protein